MRQLIYFSDPMCSWCYGFAPVIDAIRAEFRDELPIRLVLGGLRPGTEEPMTFEAREKIVSHWTEVAAASGQQFDRSALDHDGFVYDTDPAARAVVVVRRHREALALDFLERAQRAFYAEGRDVTDPRVLVELAAEFGLDREEFLIEWGSRPAKQETWADYGVAQRAGVTGFPTLVAGPSDDGTFGVVTRGYAPADQVLTILRTWVAEAGAHALN
jgi:putative protein-disulfide isomerase